ncbi:uncharacterized protein TRIADDRAFT_62389 [Trichoplax adhaerens]|uniref:Uncharacterized protein n=1 Tax=Trichoplax adhaerens TaxID=10228 RepID=B3SDN2_TRIAD|nr:predicted protein [Trichoplax adhaerens]EDV19175.1 predicted protein [Trichoplax adhaerens]|eukprot:XP_002118353.1 predicted protein [Trichoplax adhaerens]
MGSYRCQCDKATSNSSFYPHNCSMCRMTCSKGGFCVIGPDFREYCKCPPPEIDPYCSGAALPLNTILGAAVAAGASVIIISLIVGYFFYQRHQSRLRITRQDYKRDQSIIAACTNKAATVFTYFITAGTFTQMIRDWFITWIVEIHSAIVP